jgi:hypothetical protein
MRSYSAVVIQTCVALRPGHYVITHSDGGYLVTTDDPVTYVGISPTDDNHPWRVKYHPSGGTFSISYGARYLAPKDSPLPLSLVTLDSEPYPWQLVQIEGDDYRIATTTTTPQLFLGRSLLVVPTNNVFLQIEPSFHITLLRTELFLAYAFPSSIPTILNQGKRRVLHQLPYTSILTRLLVCPSA